MLVSLADFTQDIDHLVSLPSVGLRVNEMVSDSATRATDLGKVICQDPALAARLLRMANSPAYGLSTQVNTVTRAVAIIGMQQIRDLVLATSTMSAFDGLSNPLVSLEDFWSHSLYCGAAAHLLAEQCKMKHAETVFLGGLLHDIGQLVIFHKEPERAKQALLLSIEEHDDLALHLAEQEIFGFDHAEVGAALLRQWHFPELLIESVALHHAPEQARRFPIETALVHIANSIATLAEIDSVSLDDAVQIEPEAWRVTGLDNTCVERTVRFTQAQFADMRNLLLG